MPYWSVISHAVHLDLKVSQVLHMALHSRAVHVTVGLVASDIPHTFLCIL